MFTSLFGNNASKKNNKNKNVANVAVVENVAVKKNNNKTNNHKNVVNVVTDDVVVVKNNTGNQAGGVAPVGYSTPYNMRQPSEAVMDWTTRADANTPSAAEMRNVAHGGVRKTRKHKKTKNHKKAKSHKKAKKAHKNAKKSMKGKKQKKRN